MKSLELVTARQGVNHVEKVFIVFCPSCHVPCPPHIPKNIGVVKCICIIGIPGLYSVTSGRQKVFCQLLEETSIYPCDLCLVTGEGAGLEARQSSCYRSSWRQSGWVIYMFNHSKSAENYLAEFRWSNNVSVCIAQHFPFIPFLTI